jgi:hypothetical protein
VKTGGQDGFAPFRPSGCASRVATFIGEILIKDPEGGGRSIKSQPSNHDPTI